MRQFIQSVLRRFGYVLVRNRQPPRSAGTHAAPGAEPPAALRARLRRDHPRLVELRQRYAAARLPMLSPTWWTQDYVDQAIDLSRFRGDNAYIWQTRHMAEAAPLRYYLYANDVATRDTRGLFTRLTEDGAFGCWVYRSARFGALSRDLLDSVNELSFLERHLGLAQWPHLRILDIGAGYGRLAHRAHEALPNLTQYFCTDGVAESTYLSGLYLEFRGCSRAQVIPADELHRLEGVSLDLAVNVHSFSEMSLAAIDGWLDLVTRLRIPHLFIVPNDGEAMLSMEADGTRRDFEPSLAARGYRLAASEPVIADADVRDLVGVRDQLMLFSRNP